MKKIKIIILLVISSILGYSGNTIPINKVIKGSWSKNTSAKYYSFTLKKTTSVNISLLIGHHGKTSLKLFKGNKVIAYGFNGYNNRYTLSEILSAGIYTIEAKRLSSLSNFLLKIDATLELFIGNDTSDLTNRAHIAKNNFFSNLTNVHTNDFESYPIRTPIKGISFGTLGTALVELKSSSLEDVLHVDVEPYGDAVVTSGIKYLSYAPWFTLHFDVPVHAFGFYTSGIWQWLFGGHMSVVLKYASGEVKTLAVPSNGLTYFGFIERNAYKSITSIEFQIFRSNHGDYSMDDFSAAAEEDIKYLYTDIDTLPNSKDPFFNTPWIDTDNDGIANSKDPDDDNDGLSDIIEKKYKLNPLNPADAQADFDHDGFSNIIEINLGTNIRNSHSHPTWAPVIMGDIMIFIPAK